MPKDLVMSKEALLLDNDNNLVINFKNKKLTITSKNLTETEIDKIRNNNYCPGCTTLSTKGYLGSKRSWYRLSRLVANYT